MKRLLTLTMGASMLMLNACTGDTLPEVQNPQPSGDAGELAFIANSFVRSGADSRTAIVLPGNDTDGTGFVWTAGDTIGIAPSSGAQAYFVISGGEESDKATFSGGAWALKTDESSDYAAYYPFIGDIYLDRTQVPVNYLGQKYIPYDSETHKLTSLAPFDYMAAKPSRASSSSNVSFQFKHLSSLVEVQFALPKAGTVNSVFFTASEKVLPVKGTFDLTADEVAITSNEEDKAYTLSVAVEELTTTAANETVSVFFLMPPAALSGATLRFTVDYSYEEEDETVRETLPFTIAGGSNMQAETWHTYAATAMTDDALPAEMAVSWCSDFSSGINYAMEQLGGTKLRFVTGSAVVSDVEVYSGDLTSGGAGTVEPASEGSGEAGEASVKAYAVRVGEWLEVHTLAKEIVLPENVYNMFDANSYPHFALLEELDLSGLNTGKVTDMSNMFLGCSSLASLDLSGFDTSKVTNMSFMFEGCSSLASITFGDGFDTSNVTEMYSMFAGCSSLTSLDLSRFATSNVTNMSSMFAGCSSLTSLDLSGFDTSDVTDMSLMFSNCSSLTSITFGNGFGTSSVTQMYYMFWECTNLTSLDLTGFTFIEGVDCSAMLGGVGVYAASDSKTPIYVTQAGNEYLSKQQTNIDENYAELKVIETSAE